MTSLFGSQEELDSRETDCALGRELEAAASRRNVETVELASVVPEELIDDEFSVVHIYQSYCPINTAISAPLYLFVGCAVEGGST